MNDKNTQVTDANSMTDKSVGASRSVMTAYNSAVPTKDSLHGSVKQEAKPDSGSSAPDSPAPPSGSAKSKKKKSASKNPESNKRKAAPKFEDKPVPGRRRPAFQDKPLIQTTGELLLHTQLAHHIFFGRKGGKGTYPITGLIRFSGNVRGIWDAAAQDDPYADMKLIEIEEAVQVAEGLVKTNTKALNQLLKSLGDRIILGDCRADKPVSVPLSFRVPHGFIAARLLAAYDELVICGLKCKHTGLIMDDDWTRFVIKAAKKIRYAFSVSERFRYSGTTRDDFAANNPRAREAVSKYGELPQDVLEGKRRARVSPTIRGVSDDLIEDEDE